MTAQQWGCRERAIFVSAGVSQTFQRVVMYCRTKGQRNVDAVTVDVLQTFGTSGSAGWPLSAKC